MPMGARRKHLSIPILLCLSVVLGSLLPLLGHLAGSVWAQAHVRSVDSAFLHREPLQVTDMQVTLGNASWAALRADWAMVIRLIRDGRNQWEAFQTQMPSIYRDREHLWSPSTLRRSRHLWDNAVRQAESNSLPGTLRSLKQLRSILRKYRFPNPGTSVFFM